MAKKSKIRSRGIRFHLEGLAQAISSLQKNCYPVAQDGRTPVDLARGDLYLRNDLARSIRVEYECQGLKYSVEVRIV